MRKLWIIGVDEVGRGPVAGPVSVGVCAVPGTFNAERLLGIKDSKLLTPCQRNAWYDHLRALSDVRYVVASCGPKYIDRFGIVRAVKTAMQRALRTLDLDPTECELLLDGSLYAPSSYVTQTTIVHGDRVEPLISAAAILAKVTRDRHMTRLATRYPEYGFDRHMGYGTARHRAALRAYGLSPEHRVTFCDTFLNSKAVHSVS